MTTNDFPTMGIKPCGGNSTRQEGDSMTLEWKGIALHENGWMAHCTKGTKEEAREWAMQSCTKATRPSTVVWWQILVAEGVGWRPVENSLDMPEPKPITLRDVLEAEAKMRVSCSQPGTAEQLKAIMKGLDHHYMWNLHMRFKELVAYAYREDNQCLKDVSGAMAARGMSIGTALDSPILLISQRPSVQAVADKMTRMQDGTWGYHTKASTGDCE